MAFEVINDFTKQVFQSKSLQDLAGPTKAMIRKVTDIVLAEELVEFRPKVMPPPQEEIELFDVEERKGNEVFDLVSHVSKECKVFVQAM